jgi:hypothetical protein
MSEDEKDQVSNDEKEASSEKFELSDEGKEQVRAMQAAYDDDRQTAVLPGTDGTITGVAVNEWLDEDGNPKFGKDEQQEKDEKNPQQETEKQEQHAD